MLVLNLAVQLDMSRVAADSGRAKLNPIVDRQIAAANVVESLSEATTAVADQWCAEVATDAAPGCRHDGTQQTPIRFLAEQLEMRNFAIPFAAAFGSLVLCQAAGAQQAQAPAPVVTDEVIVRGRTREALRFAIERAENAVFARFNEINSRDDLDIRCTAEVRTGTRIPQRVCAPAYLRIAEATAAEDSVRALQGSYSGGGEPFMTGWAHYRNGQLEEEMRRLVREDAQLLAAMRRLMQLRGINEPTAPEQSAAAERRVREKERRR